jgi:hypothetical protein
MNSPPGPHFGPHRRRGATPPPATEHARLKALQRLRRVHRNRERVVRDLNISVPAQVLERHPQDLAWRVSVMDRWIARHLDLAGGRRLPPWTDEMDADEMDEDEDGKNSRERNPEAGDAGSKEAP